MYTKEQQLKSQRLRPKKESTFGNRKPIKKKRITTDDELDFCNWLHEEAQMQKYKCMVCGSPVYHYHHVKEYSSDKKRQFVQIPLCNEHHMGTSLSPHGSPKLFRQTYTMKYQNAQALKLHLDYLSREV